VRSSPRRLFGVAFAIALALAAIGFFWEFVRFGVGEDAAAARLEADVRATVAARTREIELLATRVAREGPLINSASTERDQLTPLFARLMDLVADNGTERISATAYVATGPRGMYRVLAWSGGAAEELPSDRLAGPRAVFAMPGYGGVRLVAVEPIETDGKRIGMAAAETILAPVVHAASAAPLWQLTTSFGPVSVTPAALVGADLQGEQPHTFQVTGPGGPPLLEAHYSLDAIDAERDVFRRRVVTVVALPLVCAALLATGFLLDARSRSTKLIDFFGWSLATGAVVVGAAWVLRWLALLVDAPVKYLILGLGALALMAVFPGSWWWRRHARRNPSDARGTFIFEQLLVGVAVAAALFALSLVFRQRMTISPSLDRWQFPLFPIELVSLVSLTGLIVMQLAVFWTAATVLAFSAGRWRLTWRQPGQALFAAALWLVPTGVYLLVQARAAGLPWASILGAGVAAAAFAIASSSLRGYYRHTTQAMRLVLTFAALFLPTVALYPMAASYADIATSELIESDYAPKTASHPQELGAELARAEVEIDHIPALAALIAAPVPPPGLGSSHEAFQVWSLTSLSHSRVTSDVELYGADRELRSRFALNLPEYIYRASTQTWSGSGCHWEVFSEAQRFGAEDRNLLHAERAICDQDGHMLGAIVIHVEPDYRSLPFVSSANPYADALGLPDAPAAVPRVNDLQVVVYGWSLHPVFASGRVAWQISRDLADHLTASRDSFWTTLPAGDRTYRVHFGSDRSHIYALGYPVSTVFEHATRLSEAATLVAAIFVVFLLGATIYAPFRRKRDVPLRLLFHEIRTSFYRKLFLFFVLAAVGPVLMLALAFGAYMTAKFRADVESEAASVVTVARKVFEELTVAEQRPDPRQTAPTDDAMVWIGQVIGQDVNLFDGARLVATSQRDLFDSGLLPVRTPAAAYQAVALNRAPTFVVPDRLGTFQYLVAAAPVPARGRDAVLSVPLALRQREIEREIDELYRGVLVGGVIVVLFAAGLGASVAGRISDPVARLTQAARQIAAGRLDVRVVAETADELRRLVDDFNTMTSTLASQRAELARTQQLKAWAEMARQVAHEIKNPLTPIQLAAEHLQRVHEDSQRPLGAVFDQCVTTILRQVRLLRQIAGEFSTFAAEPVARPTVVAVPELIEDVVGPYRPGLGRQHRIDVVTEEDLPTVLVDRTLVARALTNVIENALQAMPDGGRLQIAAQRNGAAVEVAISDTGVGMDKESVRRAFEPYFSTKTAGSGLGLANAKRNVELCGGTMTLESEAGRGTTVTLTLPAAPPRGDLDRA
jgi:signal transduction histidine kinase